MATPIHGDDSVDKQVADLAIKLRKTNTPVTMRNCSAKVLNSVAIELDRMLTEVNGYLRTRQLQSKSGQRSGRLKGR